jgi:O-antigen ligase
MNKLGRLLAWSLIAIAVVVAGRIALLGFKPTMAAALTVLSPLLLWLALSRPLVMIRTGFFLVLVAGTKFRVRDPLASMQSQADEQVFFELAVYAVIGLVTALVALGLPKNKLRLTGMELLLVGYVSIVILSAIWSPTSTFSFVRGAQIAVLLLYTFVIIRAIGPDLAWNALTTSLLVFSILFALIGLAMLGPDLTAAVRSRFGWFSTHPIQVGSFAALACLPIIAGYLFSARSISISRRSTRVASVVFLTAILLITQSRGPLLAFVVAVAALIMIRSLGGTAAALGIVLVSTLALVLLNLPSGAIGFVDALANSGIGPVEFLFRGQDVDSFLSMTGRMDLWTEMVPAFFERPFLGYGYQVARIIGMEVAPWAGEAHNALLQSLIDVGLIGTLLLLIPAFSTVITDYRNLSRPQGREIRRARYVAARFSMVRAAPALHGDHRVCPILGDGRPRCGLPVIAVHWL